MKKAEIREQLYVAEHRLSLYFKAEEAILAGQSYEIGDMKLTRANLKDVQNMIASLEKKISVLNEQLKGRARFRAITPGW